VVTGASTSRAFDRLAPVSTSSEEDDMRHALPIASALVLAGAAALPAQERPVAPRGLPPVDPAPRCCVTQVVDAKGKVFGGVIKVR
jgi:hypothetical protein